MKTGELLMLKSGRVVSHMNGEYVALSNIAKITPEDRSDNEGFIFSKRPTNVAHSADFEFSYAIGEQHVGNCFLVSFGDASTKYWAKLRFAPATKRNQCWTRDSILCYELVDSAGDTIGFYNPYGCQQDFDGWNISHKCFAKITNLELSDRSTLKF